MAEKLLPSERAWPFHARLLAHRTAALLAPDDASELLNGIIDWCNQYGLLGTLFHRVAMVSLWPRWEPGRGSWKAHSVVPTQRTHVCRPPMWHTTTSVNPLNPSNDLSRRGSPISESEFREDGWRPAAALTLGIDGLPGKDEPLHDTWARHFPDVAPAERITYAYPAPTDTEFWRIYGEPVGEFVMAACFLAQCLKDITHPADRAASAAGRLHLATLAGFGAPYLDAEADGSLRQRWITGSLLASLALMATEDLSQHRLHACERCARFFFSDAYQARYCSEKCRHTMQKRRYRHGKRKKSRHTKQKRR